MILKLLDMLQLQRASTVPHGAHSQSAVLKFMSSEEYCRCIQALSDYRGVEVAAAKMTNSRTTGSELLLPTLSVLAYEDLSGDKSILQDIIWVSSRIEVDLCSGAVDRPDYVGRATVDSLTAEVFSRTEGHFAAEVLLCRLCQLHAVP